MMILKTSWNDALLLTYIWSPVSISFANEQKKGPIGISLKKHMTLTWFYYDNLLHTIF
jgi:hypothetical protein